MGKGKKKVKGVKPETSTTDTSGGSAPKPGTSWGSDDQPPPPSQSQTQIASGPPTQSQSLPPSQSRPTRSSEPPQSWEEHAGAPEGQFDLPISSLSVEETEEDDDDWGVVTSRSRRQTSGGAWGQTQSQPQSSQWPRPQPQTRPQYQSRPQSQPRSQYPARPQSQPRLPTQTKPQPQSQPWHRPSSQPQYQTPQQPRFQVQPRPPNWTQPQGQTRVHHPSQFPPPRPLQHPSQQPPQHSSQQLPTQPRSLSGAWAGGPPQELQRSIPESVSQPLQQERPAKRKLTTGEEPPVMQDFMDFAPRLCASQKTGRSIEVFTNFFPLRLEDYNITIFHYDVVFEPDVPKYLLRRAWNATSEAYFPRRITVFDGMSNIYTKGPLVNGASFRVDMNLYHPETSKSKNYSVMLKEVRRIPMAALSNYRDRIKQSQTIDARKKAVPLAELSVIEVILKNWPANNLIQHNRVFFHKLDMRPRTTPLSDRLELRYGYFQSAFLGYQLYLNFDVAHRPFYRNDYIKNLVDEYDRTRSYSSDNDDMNHFLKGAKIEYTLPDDRKMRMVYRANKVVANAYEQTFEREGKTLTVAEYFLKEKNFRLKYPQIPLLWVGPSSKTIYLPLELVRLCPDQIYRGALSANETRKMVMGATTDARRRKDETLQAFSKANFHDNPFLREFGIRIERDMEVVKARVLEPPKLKTNTVITVREGAWKTRAFVEPKGFNKWCILNLDRTANKNHLMHLQKALQSKAREFNMSIGEPEVDPIDKGGTMSFSELQKIFSNLKNMNIVIVVISELKGLYSKVKTICETQEGILTQCIKGRNIKTDSRKMMTTLDNLLLKINAKLGGTNHCLNRNSMPSCLDGYVMVVGADVTHAGPGSRIPSVAAVAVCCEMSVFQYGITIRVQNGEIINDLKEIMRINLLNFYNIRKKYPEKIFFFRDGVSEGEMEKVLKTEYRAISEACAVFSCKAKITLLVVQKRHHTRFFPTCQSDEEGKTYNVPVGTCVDSDIVHPGGLDFYLLSHGSLLGTARPTRYRLLHDDNRLTDDELEQLTFYLCHLYSRCNRSVSYPSPTYNAHLAAFRARAYLEGLNVTDRDDLKTVQQKLKDAISINYPMFYV